MQHFSTVTVSELTFAAMVIVFIINIGEAITKELLQLLHSIGEFKNNLGAKKVPFALFSYRSSIKNQLAHSDSSLNANQKW